MAHKTLNLSKIKYKNLGFFRFKKMDNNYLLTNEVGDYLFLKPDDFKNFLEGRLDKRKKTYRKLKEKNFIKSHSATERLIEKYSQKNCFLAQGPSLHIVIPTLRCDHKCVYCQASSRPENAKNSDMDVETAEKVLEIIFSSPSKYIAVEFQGGEPLLNWKIVKFIINRSIEKAKQNQKDLQLRLVSNFSQMDDEKLNFLFNKKVNVCTSLDGPEKLHNKNRIYPKGNSYKIVTKYLKKAMKLFREREKSGYLTMPGALVTLTKESLKYPKQIVDEYLKWGFEQIYFRPTTRLGMAGKVWQRIGYSPEDYLQFYRRALNYIIEINKKGKFFYEQSTLIFLHKIFSERDPGALDWRSPCGAGIGQMVYNYNGKVYSCDEGRMVSEMGDESFLLGNVKKDRYRDLLNNKVVKTLVTASCLDNNVCDLCAYKPYCGVCPVRNYAELGDLFPPMSYNDRCKINRGILDFIFNKLENKQTKKILMNWLKR